MVDVKWPSPSLKVDLDHENDNIRKNGFYQRILQPSEHPKRVGAKKKFFFQTLLDGPLQCTNRNKHCAYTQNELHAYFC